MTTTSVDELFAHNREWAEQSERDRLRLLHRLLAQQKPRYMDRLSDSRALPCVPWAATRSRADSARCRAP